VRAYGGPGDELGRRCRSGGIGLAGRRGIFFRRHLGEILISLDVIPNGAVDRRSIVDVRPNDLKGFTQCHFFAGIGGWAEALRLAGWPDDRQVWTGSCPCQPFSTAGTRKGTADARHLWPEFQRLIAECRPATVFGEQVAGKDGRGWLAGVRTDLEALGYGVGAADLCAAGAGSPHIRQRLYWVAYAKGNGREQRRSEPDGGVIGGRGQGFWSDYDIVHCTDGKARRTGAGIFPLAHGVPARVGKLRAAGNASSRKSRRNS